MRMHFRKRFRNRILHEHNIHSALLHEAHAFESPELFVVELDGQLFKVRAVRAVSPDVNVEGENAQIDGGDVLQECDGCASGTVVEI